MNVDAGLEVISAGSRWCLFRAGRGTLCDVDAMEYRKRINSVEKVQSFCHHVWIPKCERSILVSNGWITTRDILAEWITWFFRLIFLSYGESLWWCISFCGSKVFLEVLPCAAVLPWLKMMVVRGAQPELEGGKRSKISKEGW